MADDSASNSSEAVSIPILQAIELVAILQADLHPRVSMVELQPTIPKLVEECQVDLGDRPVSKLGERLLEIRRQAIAEGLQLLAGDEIDQMIDDMRGHNI